MSRSCAGILYCNFNEIDRLNILFLYLLENSPRKGLKRCENVFSKTFSQYITARQFPGCCTASLAKPDPLAAKPLQLKGNALIMMSMAEGRRVFTDAKHSSSYCYLFMSSSAN